MKSYKKLINEVVNKTNYIKTLSPEESKALKACILDIYKNVADVCEKNQLRIFLVGGSCLGAVRHQGFIPWDDDLDVILPRPDYEKLIELCDQGALGEKFEVRHPHGKKDSMTMFMKVFLKGTKLVDLINENQPFPQMVHIDVFALDGYSSNKYIRRWKGLVANTLRLIANIVNESRGLARVQKTFYQSDPDLWKLVKMRRFVGKCFSIISHRHWINWYDSWVKGYDMNGIVGLPTGRKLYEGEVFHVSKYLPPKECLFEGIKMYLPADPDNYLINLYGDYMTIPPVEKRESHFIIDLQLPEKYYE